MNNKTIKKMKRSPRWLQPVMSALVLLPDDWLAPPELGLRESL
jgi:hypothetical protein